MPLVYNSFGRKLYVLYRISTSTVINRSVVYPAAVDDDPIIGLDPDLQYLAMDRDVTPDYDPRVYDLVTSEAKVANLWRITYGTQRKDATQIKIAVTNKEATEITNHVRAMERDKLMVLGLGVLFAELSSLTLNARQQAVKNKIIAAATKIWQNDQRVTELFAQIDTNQVPDIDTGWALPS